jgi:hypothetical protein
LLCIIIIVIITLMGRGRDMAQKEIWPIMDAGDDFGGNSEISGVLVAGQNQGGVLLQGLIVIPLFMPIVGSWQ